MALDKHRDAAARRGSVARIGKAVFWIVLLVATADLGYRSFAANVARHRTEARSDTTHDDASRSDTVLSDALHTDALPSEASPTDAFHVDVAGKGAGEDELGGYTGPLQSLALQSLASAEYAKEAAGLFGPLGFAVDEVAPIAAEELDIVTVGEQTPLFTRCFLATTPEAPSVHASTITPLPDGGLIAAWFGGTREGAKDVSIYQSRWNTESRSWETPRVVTNRSQTSRELGRYVKKLGNPVLFCNSSGRVWLYYVTVSIGGWSGASISLKYSDDRGQTWSGARRLITSPFLNVSTLVRATPIALQDGGLLLPVYHECLFQFGELLRIDAEGRLMHKYRMNSGGDLLQPTLAPLSATDLLAFYRRGTGTEPELYFNRSTDAGQTWSALKPTNLPNPNASVAVVRTHSGNLLMSFNPSEDSRQQLAIASSSDGENWEVLDVLESGAAGQEFSYPSLICGEAGVYHLTYTWNREKICHVTFNDAWVEARR